MQLPRDMIAEIERLGENPAKIEWIAREQNVGFARSFLQDLTESAAIFDERYPQLRQFAADKRRADPLPDEAALNPTELAFRRILQPKIAQAGRVSHRNNFTAVIFSAPLVVLPLVIADWPSTYRNPVFLTADELAEWQATQPDEFGGIWWCIYQHWNIQPDPPDDADWREHSKLRAPENETELLVTWGLCWGSLAGGENAELWSVARDGRETFLGELWDETY